MMILFFISRSFASSLLFVGEEEAEICRTSQKERERQGQRTKSKEDEGIRRNQCVVMRRKFQALVELNLTSRERKRKEIKKRRKTGKWKEKRRESMCRVVQTNDVEKERKRLTKRVFCVAIVNNC